MAPDDPRYRRLAGSVPRGSGLRGGGSRRGSGGDDDDDDGGRRSTGGRETGRSGRGAAAGRVGRASRIRTAAGRGRTRGAGSRRYDARSYRTAAGQRLRRFRQQTQLAVAMTALALLLAGSDGSAATGAVLQPGSAADTVVVSPLPAGAGATAAAADSGALLDSAGIGDEAARSVEEATSTIRSLVRGSYRVIPKLGIAVLLLLVAAVATRLARPVMRYLLASFERAEAISALVGIGVWLVALGAAVSVLAGDARALLGSVGLFGLALSWALQAPIESFTGWLLNSFRGYYAVGDRILVGDVFGDVYRIDFLTTMVWEAGGPGKAVSAAQSTGAIVTFPNSEVLRSNITNFTRDFPYVWDELTVGVANESDLPYALSVVRGVVERVLGDSMVAPAAEYSALLSRASLDGDVASHPQLYVSPTDSWVDITVRYLVPVRQRRGRATELQVALSVELARPEHAPRIVGSYPVRRIVRDGDA